MISGKTDAVLAGMIARIYIHIYALHPTWFTTESISRVIDSIALFVRTIAAIANQKVQPSAAVRACACGGAEAARAVVPRDIAGPNFT